MPEMGGVQLAAEMTAKQPGLKVLFSSGYTDSALTQRGALVAGVDLLQKPYSPAVLVQRIRAKLDGPTSA
jgi:DNA-binding response OmpR family regulator